MRHKKSSLHTAGHLGSHEHKLNGPPQPSKYSSDGDLVPEGEPWIWQTREILKSAALRSLSVYGRRALDRIMAEHLDQGRRENGRLKVTWGDFGKCGINPRRIKSALDELFASGFVINTVPGRRSYGADRGAAAQYALTWLPIFEPGNTIPASNEWRKFFPPLPPVALESTTPGGTGKPRFSTTPGGRKTADSLLPPVALPSISRLPAPEPRKAHRMAEPARSIPARPTADPAEPARVSNVFILYGCGNRVARGSPPAPDTCVVLRGRDFSDRKAIR